MLVLNRITENYKFSILFLYIMAITVNESFVYKVSSASAWKSIKLVRTWHESGVTMVTLLLLHVLVTRVRYDNSSPGNLHFG